jgi:hypothetical protein
MKKAFSIFTALVAFLTFAVVQSAQAAAETGLTEASSTADTLYGGRVGNYSVSFITNDELPKSTKIIISFPAGFVLPTTIATTTISVSYAGSPIVGTSTVSGQSLTVDIDDGTNPLAASSTIQIKNIPSIKNPFVGKSLQLDIRVKNNQTGALLAASGTVNAASSTAFNIVDAPRTSSQQSPVAVYVAPPSSKITSPTQGLKIAAGSPYTIAGTAWDQGIYAVSKVEVSVDGGATWLEATLTGGNWQYVWANPTQGDYTIWSRAKDSAGNVENLATGVKVSVSASPVSTPAPASEMSTIQQLQTQVVSLQQQVVALLQQLIQLLTAQL